MKKFNVNNYVNIKLTDAGIAILKSKYDDVLKKCANNPDALKILGEFKPPEVDENGYTRMTLWEVMQTFGNYISFGNTSLPFEVNIAISEEYLNDLENGKKL